MIFLVSASAICWRMFRNARTWGLIAISYAETQGFAEEAAFLYRRTWGLISVSQGLGDGPSRSVKDLGMVCGKR